MLEVDFAGECGRTSWTKFWEEDLVGMMVQNIGTSDGDYLGELESMYG